MTGKHFIGNDFSERKHSNKESGFDPNGPLMRPSNIQGTEGTTGVLAVVGFIAFVFAAQFLIGWGVQ
jgi:hypothetical protein